MANKKYKLSNSDYWETSGVYDITEGKTQREVNAALKGSLNTVNDNTPYSESFTPVSLSSSLALQNSATVRVMSYNVAKYNNNTAVTMPDQKVQNFRKMVDEYHPDFMCVQEDMQYYDDSSRDAVAYLYSPVLNEYYRAGTNYDINIHAQYPTAEGATNQKVMFTGVTSRARAMQVCTFPIKNSDKKLLVCCVHCPWADSGGDGDSAENIALRNSVYQEIFQFVSGEIQLYNVGNTLVSVPPHDYAVICMDANCETPTDKTNLLTAASAENFIPANGGKFGWFATCQNTDNTKSAIDNIFVSNNIALINIHALWNKYDDLYSDHIPLVADLVLANAQTIIDIGTTPNWITVPTASYVDVPITFNKTFTAQPTVFCTLISDSSSSEIGSLEAVVYSATTSGATIRIYNNASSGRSPKVSWLAIGN